MQIYLNMSQLEVPSKLGSLARRYAGFVGLASLRFGLISFKLLAQRAGCGLTCLAAAISGAAFAQGAPTSSSAAADAAAARIEALEKAVSQLTVAGGPSAAAFGVALHGFASVGLSKVRNAPAGTRDGFAVGSLDFYLTPEFGGRVKTLFELNFETRDNGEAIIDLERAQIGYTFSDRLTIWAGRFHTPFGWWNSAFHHGAQLQTSILRPRFLDFEDDGGILPVHTVGLMAVGAARVGPGRFNYHAYAGNANRIADGVLNPNAGGDDSGKHLLGFNAGYRFNAALDGLALGAHGFREQVGAYDAAGAQTSRTRVGMLGGWAVYDDGGWEVISEYYHFRDTNLSGSGATQGSWAGFAQAGHSVQDRWMPYVRAEKAVLNRADAYFTAQTNGQSYSRQVLGLRYNVDPRSAAKAELNRTRDAGVGHAVDMFRLQFVVSF